MSTSSLAEGIWWDGFGSSSAPGVGNEVFCSTVYDGSLVLGGTFLAAGAVAADRIVQWDGVSWRSLGKGFVSDGGWVAALATYEGDLIAGGNFYGVVDGPTANHIARWNGSEWSPMGSGLGSTVCALAVYNGHLIAGGLFPGHIASWDGASWTQLGSGLDGDVYALAIYNGDLIVGGHFTRAGETRVASIARWDGTAFSPLGNGITDGAREVHALQPYQGLLVVGGRFPPSNLAVWDGAEWGAMGNGTDQIVTSFYYDPVAGLFMGGMFTSPANLIARWDGSSWQPLGGGLSATWVLTITMWNGLLIAGGTFAQADLIDVANVAAWNGSAWEAIGSAYVGHGLSGDITRAFTIHDGRLVAAYYDRYPGDSHVVEWDGSSWTGFGSIAGQGILSVVDYQGDLYVSTTDYWVSRWDGNEWVHVGQSILANGLFVIGDVLYAAGRRDVFRWDGAAWISIGGFDADVFALAGFNGDVVATGAFTSLDGGEPAGGIAAFDGTSWRALDPSGLLGTNPVGYALTVCGGSLIVGGQFHWAGNHIATNIARWDGTRFYPCGSGTDRVVRALTCFGPDVIAEGDFATAGDVDANHIARWNGTSWSALGLGLWDGSYETGGALAVWNGDLYAGRYFTAAGEYRSYLIARWIESPADAPDISDPGFPSLRFHVPNPFHAMDAIRLDAGVGTTSLEVGVYSVDGRCVRHLVGVREVRWDGRFERGGSAPTGSYFILARSGRALGQQRIVYLK